jgi:hypothetical protein
MFTKNTPPLYTWICPLASVVRIPIVGVIPVHGVVTQVNTTGAVGAVLSVFNKNHPV